MKLFTKVIEAKLRANHAKYAQSKTGKGDFVPVVKLFTPDAGATWLLTDLDEDGIAFGLCDLGLGSPELGSVSMDEIRGLRGRLGLPVERDLGFKGIAPISAYAEAAREAGRITYFGERLTTE